MCEVQGIIRARSAPALDLVWDTPVGSMSPPVPHLRRISDSSTDLAIADASLASHVGTRIEGPSAARSFQSNPGTFKEHHVLGLHTRAPILDTEPGPTSLSCTYAASLRRPAAAACGTRPTLLLSPTQPWPSSPPPTAMTPRSLRAAQSRCNPWWPCRAPAPATPWYTGRHYARTAGARASTRPAARAASTRTSPMTARTTRRPAAT